MFYDAAYYHTAGERERGRTLVREPVPDIRTPGPRRIIPRSPRWRSRRSRRDPRPRRQLARACATPSRCSGRSVVAPDRPARARGGGRPGRMDRGRDRGGVPVPLGERRSRHVGDVRRRVDRRRLAARVPLRCADAASGSPSRWVSCAAWPRWRALSCSSWYLSSSSSFRCVRRGDACAERVCGSRQSVVLAAVVVIGPWIVFNASRFDRPILLSTNDGTALRGASCDSVFYGPETGLWSLACVLPVPKGDESVQSADVSLGRGAVRTSSTSTGIPVVAARPRPAGCGASSGRAT